MQPTLVPEFSSICGIETVDAVIPRSKEDPSVRDVGAGLQMAASRKAPELLPRGRGEGVEAAIRVLVKALAHEDLPVADGGRRKNRVAGLRLPGLLPAGKVKAEHPAGRAEDALEITRKYEEGGNSFALVLIYASMGENDIAYEWLLKAREDKIPWYPWLLKWFPHTRELRDDPRVVALSAELEM